MRLRTAAALVLVLTSAYAQDSASPALVATPRREDLCIIEGVVVKSSTGEGLKKIEVTAYPVGGNPSSAGGFPQGNVTDANGHFIISGLAPGRYVLNASGNGYPPQSYRPYGRAGANFVTLASGSHEKNITLRLTSPGVITGTVYDTDGDPAINAWVSAARVTYTGHQPRTLSSSGAQTNDLGQYRIFGLPPGKYILSAGLQNFSAANSSNGEVILPTFYPGTVDPAEADTVRLEADAELSGIDIGLQQAHAVSVRGRVAAAGIPLQSIRGAWVQLMPRSAVEGLRTDTRGGPIADDHGDFEIRGVPPGSYLLVMSWNDGKHSLAGQTTVEAGATDVEGVSLTVGPGIELTGRFLVEPGGTLGPGQLNVGLSALEGGFGGAGAQSEPDGTFVISNLMQGAYRLRVSGFPEEYYVKSARLAGADVLGPGLVVGQAQPVGPLEISLGLDGGRLDGVVMKAQQPSAGALVALVPDPPNRDRQDLYDSKNSDALGRFSLLGLPPGDYKLFAWEPQEGLPFNDPEFIKEHEKQGTPVHIESTKQQYVPVNLIPAENSPDP